MLPPRIVAALLNLLACVDSISILFSCEIHLSVNVTDETVCTMSFARHATVFVLTDFASTKFGWALAARKQRREWRRLRCRQI